MSAYSLLKRIYLLRLPVKSTCEFSWDEPPAEISVLEFFSKDFMDLSERDFRLDLIYTAFQVNERGPELYEEIYEYLVHETYFRLVLSDVLCYGPEPLEKPEELMSDWCSFLMAKSTRSSLPLLSDACLYMGPDVLERTALECAKDHPSLLLIAAEKYCENKNWEAVLAFVKNGLALLGDDYIISSELSSLAYEAAVQLGRNDELSHFAALACYAKPSYKNILRLYSLKDESLLPPQLARLKQLNTLNRRCNYDEEANPSYIEYSDNYYAYCCLLGEEKEALKAASQFSFFPGMPESVFSLLLLGLLEEKGSKSLAESRLLAETISQMTPYNPVKKDNHDESISLYFSAWRVYFHRKEKDTEYFLDALISGVTSMADHILERRHRKLYEEAAIWLSALSLVLYEYGRTYEGGDLITYYRMEHSRKSSFLFELKKACGR